MSLISLIIALIILGLLLYVVKLLPIDGTVKQIISAVVVVAIVIWLLRAVVGFGGDIRLG